MSSTVSGTIQVASSINVSVTPGTNLTNYTIPVNLQSTDSYSAGTGANQANKVYQGALSLVGAAQSLDLTALVCVDGAVGFAHVREVLVFNDATVDGKIITVADVANTINSFYLTGTTPATTVQAGTVWRQAKPIGTAGWVVDSSHKILKLDPGADTIACRVEIIGD